MIDITQLTEKDIGRHVLYWDPAAGVREWGRITSWNEKYIFVRYHTKQVGREQKEDLKNQTSAATHPRSLEFA